MKVRPKLLKKLKMLMILCFIGTIAMTSITVVEVLEIKELKETGITTEGVYHSDNSLSTGKGRTAYRILVDYKPENLVEHRKLFVVPEDLYHAIKENGFTKVVYLKRNAEISEIKENLSYNYEKAAIAGGLLVVGLVILFYFRSLRLKIEREVELKQSEIQTQLSTHFALRASLAIVLDVRK